MDTQPAVTCSSCGRAWHSATMAEGLRLIGSCPRCDGELEFRDAATPAEPRSSEQHAQDTAGATASPQSVLGIPRR